MAVSIDVIRGIRIRAADSLPDNMIFAIERVIAVSDVESILLIRCFGGEKHEVRIPFGRKHVRNQMLAMTFPVRSRPKKPDDMTPATGREEGDDGRSDSSIETTDTTRSDTG